MKHLSLSGFERQNILTPFRRRKAVDQEVGMEGGAGKRQSGCWREDLRIRTASLA